jgi:hypothetical protein
MKGVPRGVYVVVLIVVVAGGALTIGLLSSKLSGDRCAAHEVTIENDKVSPRTTTGKVCGTMTITNKDDVTRLIAFGDHDHHIPYDGIEDRLLHKGESVTLTFDAVGSFHFHDHMHDEVEGYFTVTR